MMLVKFCNPEHNLTTGCNTLRLGTLQYYRELDPQFLIADAGEGVDEHMVNHVGTGPMDDETVQFLASTGYFTPDMYIQGINFRRTFPNCYIWCCKLCDEAPNSDDGNQFDDGYSSFYRITNPDQFSMQIANLLSQSIRIKNLSEDALKILGNIPLLEYGDFGIACFHGPVVYVEKKGGTLSFGSMDTYAKQIPAQLRQLYVKTSKYAQDKEYRFSFLLQHKRTGNVLPVAKDPHDITLLPISAID